MINSMAPSLRQILKLHFGYDSFRPLQEEIITDALAGCDVLALLPTGGGKSLCYQLPALVRPGLTLVVSPLISLMKDQVDALHAGGIAATFLNSTLTPDESRLRIRELYQGRYRLLYVAPERALLTGFLQDVVRWNVNLIAIDEAHCISEWGHDFRPEYRQLIELRKALPEVPFMALTATATDLVRKDIHSYLQFRNGKNYVASFNRPNLHYKVFPKVNAYKQVLAFIRERKSESGIIYCQSRKRTETLAERLNRDCITALPYHAGMEAADRTRNQEQFVRDEVRVICATIAFGMGIDKSNVRFVLHYDLPKNIEGYYQETGRAGRDGLPSECLLLFSPADEIKQRYFIDEKEDAQQRQIALAQLAQMIEYAESSECRRSLLLGYFGEKYTEVNCNGCDNCVTPREMQDATIEAQKLLSCVYRIQQKSGFAMGLRHSVEVLMGADTEKIKRWNHTELSTYGIGLERPRKQWMSIGRELIRRGFLRQFFHKKHPVVELTPVGLEALRNRSTFMLSTPLDYARTVKTVETDEYDGKLFERLRTVRKRIADNRNVPAYVIFSDASLRAMARLYPTTDEEFMRVSGVGEAKRRDFGEIFTGEITEYLKSNPRRNFTTNPSPAHSKGINDSARITWDLFRAGRSIDEIAVSRNLAPITVYSHLLLVVNTGESIDLSRFVTPQEHEEIRTALRIHGDTNLAGIFEALGKRIDYEVLRLVRAMELRKPSTA